MNQKQTRKTKRSETHKSQIVNANQTSLLEISFSKYANNCVLCNLRYFFLSVLVYED